jgi:hypothetical protein
MTTSPADFFGNASALGMRYKFEICDSLINVGPISDMAVGHNALRQVCTRIYFASWYVYYFIVGSSKEPTMSRIRI